MTIEEILKNKFPNADKLDWYKPISNAMDEYAKEVAIDFKEWQDANLEDKGWQQYDGYDRWINMRNMKVISTVQLYDLYLQSKQITNGNG